jgi:NADH:ubiquinone oxidoreductase subunit 3 (subunit A)
LVFEAVLTIIILLILIGDLPLIAYAIGRAVAPSLDFPTKRERFESGNPPSGRAKGFFVMQYYPYLLMFAALEPFLILVMFIVLSFTVVTLSYKILLTLNLTKVLATFVR